MPRTAYYLTGYPLPEAPWPEAEYFQEAEVQPIFLLPGAGYNLFTPGWDWERPLAELRNRLAGPLHVALRCANLRRAGALGGFTLLPWDDDSGWRELFSQLDRLSESCQRHRITGVFFDGQVTTGCRRGAPMGRRAWPTSYLAEIRGRQFARALPRVTLGQYIQVAEGRRLPGWQQFWRGAYQDHYDPLLLDEGGYLGRESRWGGEFTRWLPGRKLVADSTAHSLQRQLPRRGDFWLSPLDTEPNLLHLAAAWH